MNSDRKFQISGIPLIHFHLRIRILEEIAILIYLTAVFNKPMANLNAVRQQASDKLNMILFVLYTNLSLTWLSWTEEKHHPVLRAIDQLVRVADNCAVLCYYCATTAGLLCGIV